MSEDKYFKDGGPAFPCEGGADSGLYADPGMSLRDWFAGQALPSLLAELYTVSRIEQRSYEGSIFETASLASYEVADKMIDARKAGA